MKIKEFQIKNFRSIKSLNVRVVNNYVQLIGENNSGKTNILLALKLFFSKSLAGLTKIDFFMEELNNDINISVSFNNLTPSEITSFQDYIINGILKIERTFNINEDSLKAYSNFFLCQKIPDIPYFKEDYISNWSANKSEINDWIRENGYETYFYNENGNLAKNS